MNELSFLNAKSFYPTVSLQRSNLLFDICRGICSTDAQVKHVIQTLISPLAEGYEELYREQKNFPTLQKCGKEEFFGLRDFYRCAIRVRH